MRKKTKIIFIAILSVLILFFVFPYIKAEYYTTKYGEAFEDLYTQTSWIESIEYFKVVEYDSSQATVLYIEKGHVTCFEVIFVQNNGSWELDKMNCVWSTSGSADSFYWPYYR